MVGSQQIVRFHYQIVGSVALYGIATERKRARAIGSVANGSFEFVGERYGVEHLRTTFKPKFILQFGYTIIFLAFMFYGGRQIVGGVQP